MAMRFVLISTLLFGLAPMAAAENLKPPKRCCDEGGVTVQLDVVFIRASVGVVEKIGFEIPKVNQPGILLSDQQVRRLLDESQGDRWTQAKRMPILAIPNGQKAAMQTGELDSFISGYKVTAKNGRCATATERTTLFLGSKLEARVNASPNKTTAKIKLRAAISERLKGGAKRLPVNTALTPATENGDNLNEIRTTFTQFIDVPRIVRCGLNVEAVIPNGKTMLFSGGDALTEQAVRTHLLGMEDLPFLSEFFNTVRYEEIKQHLYVLVTARVVDAGQDDVIQTGSVESMAGTFMDRHPYSVSVHYGTPDDIQEDIKKTATAEERCADRPNGCCANKDKSTPLAEAMNCQVPKPPVEEPEAAGCSSRMNLADVVALSTSGISDEIIINQMRTTGTTFALCTEDILFLKRNKVSDRVVMEMQNSRQQPRPIVISVVSTPVSPPGLIAVRRLDMEIVPLPLSFDRPIPVNFAPPWPCDFDLMPLGPAQMPYVAPKQRMPRIGEKPEDARKCPAAQSSVN